LGQRERALVYPLDIWPAGGVFKGRAVVMDAGDVQRAVWRIAHEIIERNRGAEDLVVVGLQTGGVWLGLELAAVVSTVAGKQVPVGATEIPVPLDGAVVVLCDDVLFTGRTVRAALNALSDLGRPAAVQLAVMVDRGHRELPVRPDYVGKNLPTSRLEMVDVSRDGVWIGDIVEGGTVSEGVSVSDATGEAP
jgi:pyrimidine operon attenuation protein/uracil phosphoribosyltransferase